MSPSDQFRKPWARSERAVPRLVIRPLERYLQRETGSASLLMASAAIALVWANLGPDSYERVWTSVVSIDIGALRIEEDLRHWINDLLMAIFFYVVALEVKREMVVGSLRDRRAAAVPAAAALGTMVGASLTYLAVNLIGNGDLRGWAIPIATDIAFTLGVLGLAGRRAPRELRAFMLTLAVVDDIGTILVIAVAFSTGISLAWLFAAALVVASIVFAQRIGIRSLVPYIVLAGLLWLAVFESGVHATIAGVVLGFLTPAVAFHSRGRTSDFVGARLDEISGSDVEVSEGTLLEISKLSEEAVSPLARMEERLHPWSAYAILPLFALANAGVPFTPGAIVDALSGPIGLGVFLGLVIGAPLCGFFFAWGITRAGAGRMPEGLDWASIGAVTPLKGIGFTIAIFISTLAFDEVELQEQAKLAILVASATAAVIGLVGIYGRSVFVRRGGSP